MLLQSHRHFDIVAHYDPATREFAAFSRTAEPARAAGPVAGHFDFLGEALTLIFRLDGGLFVEIGGRRFPLDRVAVDIRSDNRHRHLRVVSEGKEVVELTYDAPKLDPPLSVDPTPFVQAEDFDFGLFLQNVSRDPARLGRMYLA